MRREGEELLRQNMAAAHEKLQAQLDEAKRHLEKGEWGLANAALIMGGQTFQNLVDKADLYYSTLGRPRSEFKAEIADGWKTLMQASRDLLNAVFKAGMAAGQPKCPTGTKLVCKG